MHRSLHQSDRGFTLVDTLATVAVLGIVLAIAVPMMTDLTTGLRLAEDTRSVERELQTARLKAVTSNRPIRVRFNCPTAGDFRMVELIGTTRTPDAGDTPAARCAESGYPYPADTDPMTVPNHDGPLRQLQLGVVFGSSVRTVEFWPDGTAHVDQGTGNPWPVIPSTGISIVLQQGPKTKAITVNGLGRIQIS